MSNQAERIRAFKLAQHARIQKQDEEEQWISSEELCTEGSSDEETHACVKTSQRKPKRNVQRETRGISPLAQSPKLVEPTSTYQTDSQFLLPDINVTNRVVDKGASSSNDSCSSFVTKPSTDINTKQVAEINETAKVCNLKDDMDDVYDDPEIEQLIQWRPKRGSIKLPEFDEGRTSSISHRIFETKIFYEEMAIKVNVLKRKSHRKIKNTTDDDKTLIKFEDPSIKRMFKNLSKLDDKLSQVNTELEMERSERQCVQKLLCETYSKTNSTCVNSKDLQDFLDLCELENKVEGEQVDLKNENSTHEEVKKIIENDDQPFIKRNIELAKNSSMSQFSLTDEEKLHLDSILSDLDCEEYNAVDNVKKCCKLPVADEDSDCKLLHQQNVNYFKLVDDEVAIIKSLDSKLNEVIQSYDAEDEQAAAQHKSLLSLEDDNNTLEFAEKQGKLWKHFQLKKLLETIDKNLESISLQDLEEQKKLEQNNSIEQNKLEGIKNNIDDDT